MNTLRVSPFNHLSIDELFNPFLETSIGFEDLFHRMSHHRAQPSREKYPPYNITRGENENQYSITIAVAGFTQEDLQIEQKDETLTISGKQKTENEDERHVFKGIAARSFERRFQLSEYTEVKEAKLENGLLIIDLERIIPEAEKPLVVPINGGKVKNRPKFLQD